MQYPMNPYKFWKYSPFSWKFYFLTSLMMYIAEIIFPQQFGLLLLNSPYLTFYEYQIWRIITPFFWMPVQPITIVTMTFVFFWMNYRLEDRKLSTCYVLVDVFIQNLLIHILFTLISVAFIECVGKDYAFYLMGYGMIPFMIGSQFRKTSTNPEEWNQICHMSIKVRQKYCPWVLVTVFSITSFQWLFYQLLSCILSTIISALQWYILESSLIKLPLGFYQQLEACLPKFLTSRSDFVKIRKVEATLAAECWNYPKPNEYAQPHQQSAPNSLTDISEQISRINSAAGVTNSNNEIDQELNLASGSNVGNEALSENLQSQEDSIQ